MPVPERTEKQRMAAHARAFAADWPEGQRMRIQDWFMIAWARMIPMLLPMPDGQTLNLGAGLRPIGKAESLDLEHGWNAEVDLIPYPDGSVAGIWAHGFFEHLHPRAAINCLLECERVLQAGGVLNICVPHAKCENADEEIEHYSRWTENTIPNLISNPYYEHQQPLKRLHVHTTFIMGVVWRNMAVFTQLVKEGE